MEGPLDMGGNKTDLDMEIEKYQREIEEKQRLTRDQDGGYAPPEQDDPQEMNQDDQQYGQYHNEQDYDVYSVDTQQPSDQNAQSDVQDEVPEDGEDAMYFTSVNTDRSKKPVKRPVNPRMTRQQQEQQQKGFLSKLFNRDNPQ